MTDGVWTSLARELDAWVVAGLVARVWWRDDDAVTSTESLSTLIDLAGPRPLAMAIVPGKADTSLADRLEPIETVSALPHGWMHANHEPADQKRAEFGEIRDMAVALAEIDRGAALLQTLLPSRYRPIFVPPWNRIAPTMAAELDARGLAVSTFNDRPPGSGATRLNTHVDILDWAAKKRDGRAAFLGEALVVGGLVGALSRRRLRGEGTDPSEPVGVLSHHLEHDAATWRFLESLLPRLDGHPAVRWIAAEEGIDR